MVMTMMMMMITKVKAKGLPAPTPILKGLLLTPWAVAFQSFEPLFAILKLSLSDQNFYHQAKKMQEKGIKNLQIGCKLRVPS